ncbi:MAG: divergent polysaccharide deacetylase family protein, partial [Candidatus Acidiferrum sp.]
PALNTKSTSGKPSSARLAIILDDLGSDRAVAEAIFSLPYPLTISVLPNHEHSVDIAEEAHRRGYQVMLHLPMQSVGNEMPEAQGLHPGMNGQEVSSIVDQFLQSIPNVVGVNNHQGSQATADAALMSDLMPVLREHSLFYVDSRTTAATVAFDTAQREGVRSAFRNVPFLDDDAEVAAVRKQLKLALKGAREKGEAIAIGHPHPATLQALREVLPQAEAQGVHLVFVSELVH